MLMKNEKSFKEKIRKTSGLNIQFTKPLYGGVSPYQVWEAAVYNSHPKSVIVKIGKDVGIKEGKGELLLSKYLPLVPSIFFGEDFAIYEKIDGITLDEIVKSNNAKALLFFQNYTNLHLKLWQNTYSANTSINGYSQKIDENYKIINSLKIPSSSGNVIPAEEILDLDWIINNKNIGKPRDLINKSNSNIIQTGEGVLTHGDESALNAIIQNSTDKLMILDNGDVGVRCVYESIAKLLLWFDATLSNPEYFYLQKKGKNINLKFKLSLPDHVDRLVGKIKILFKDYMKGKDKEIIDSYMRMYFLREIQWTKARGRENLSPFLFAKALDLA